MGDLSALCLIPSPVSVQVENYLSHYLDIQAAYEIEVYSCFILQLRQYIPVPLQIEL